MLKQQYVYTIYDTKNKGKAVLRGSAKFCAEQLFIHYTSLQRAAINGTKVLKRYKVSRKHV